MEKIDIDAILAKAAPRPWQACGHERGGCACGQVWSLPADAHIATALAEWEGGTIDRRRADLTAEIDTGDHVYHKPTRETWLVRRVSVGHLYWCGWPPGVAALSDCRLVYKATPTERGQLQAELSRSLHEAAE